MIELVLKGILMGLSIALFFGFGPSFFAVFQTALHKGHKKGSLMAIGVFLSDVIMVILSVLGAKRVIENSERYEILGLIGGVILIIFGFIIFKKKSLGNSKDKRSDIKIKSSHPIVYTIKGFFLNIANPFIWLFWASVVMGVAAPMKQKEINIMLFLSSILFTILAIDLTKVFIANKIKPIINDRFLMGINKTTGVILIIFGITLLIKTVMEYSGIS
jgi:threonine/homoserine/homoserine lactone efflux protein